MTNKTLAIRLWFRIPKQMSEKVDVKERYHLQTINTILLRAKSSLRESWSNYHRYGWYINSG